MLHTLSWQRQKNVDYSCLSVVTFSCSGDVCFLAATSWVRGTSSSELSESSTRVFFSVIIQDYLKQDDSIIIINFHSNFFNYCVLSFVKRDLPQNLTIIYFDIARPTPYYERFWEAISLWVFSLPNLLWRESGESKNLSKCFSVPCFVLKAF